MIETPWLIVVDEVRLCVVRCVQGIDCACHPALLRCLEILDRAGRNADVAGLPDPPINAQRFRRLAATATPDDTTL
jgi:hypothetical protein